MINDISQQPSSRPRYDAKRCSPICLWRRLPPFFAAVAAFLPTQASTLADGQRDGRMDMGISFTRGGIMFWWWHVFLHTKYANAKKRKIFMKLPQNSQANVVKSWKIRFFLCCTQERGSFHPQNNTSDQITMLARRSRQSSHPRGWWVQETERWWLWEGSAGGATEAEIFILR